MESQNKLEILETNSDNLQTILNDMMLNIGKYADSLKDCCVSYLENEKEFTDLRNIIITDSLVYCNQVVPETEECLISLKEMFDTFLFYDDANDFLANIHI